MGDNLKKSRLDVRFVEAGALEDDDRAGDRAIGEVVEVDGGTKFQVFSIQFQFFRM